jgi:hypothetical protein
VTSYLGNIFDNPLFQEDYQYQQPPDLPSLPPSPDSSNNNNNWSSSYQQQQQPNPIPTNYNSNPLFQEDYSYTYTPPPAQQSGYIGNIFDNGQGQGQLPSLPQLPQQQQQSIPSGSGNPLSYLGNIWEGFTKGAGDWISKAQQQNKEEKFLPWQVWNAASSGVGGALSGVLGATSEALKPVGGGVDLAADSNIPGLSQAGQVVRTGWEQGVEPIGNFTFSAIGDISKGRYPEVLGDAFTTLLRGGDDNNNNDNNLPQEYAQRKQQIVQQVYDQGVAEGKSQEEIARLVQRANEKYSNPANLAEYQGLLDFSQLHPAIQAAAMFADPVGRTAYGFPLTGELPGAISATRAGRAIQGVTERVAPLPAARALAGKVGDVTGVSGELARLGEVLKSPQQRAATFANESGLMGQDLEYLANQTDRTPHELLSEIINNPDSPFYQQLASTLGEDVKNLSREYLDYTDYLEKEGNPQAVNEQMAARQAFDLGKPENYTGPGFDQLGLPKKTTATTTEPPSILNEFFPESAGQESLLPVPASPKTGVSGGVRENPGNWQHVKMPGKDATAAEIVQALQEAHSLNVKAARVTAAKGPPGSSTGSKPATIVPTKPLEQFGWAGKVLNRFGELTLPAESRLFLNSMGRAIRDSASNVSKLVMERIPLTGYKQVAERYDRLNGSYTQNLGGASIVADAGAGAGAKAGEVVNTTAVGRNMAGGPESAVKTLAYTLLAPQNELPSLFLRKISKGKFTNLNDFTEKAEAGIKGYVYKREVLKLFDASVDDAVARGQLPPELAGAMKAGTADLRTVANFIKGRMPPGADLRMAVSGQYHPLNFSGEVMDYIERSWGGSTSPFGNSLSDVLRTVPERLEAWNRQKLAEYQSLTGPNRSRNPKSYALQQRTRAANAPRPARVEEINPAHPFWKQLEQDLNREWDAAYVAHAGKELADPQISAAAKQAVHDALVWIATDKSISALKRVFSQWQDRNEGLYKARYGNRPPARPSPSTSPAKNGAGAGAEVIYVNLKDGRKVPYPLSLEQAAVYEQALKKYGNYKSDVGHASQLATIKRYLSGELNDREVKAGRVLARKPNGEGFYYPKPDQVKPEEILGPPDRVVTATATPTEEIKIAESAPEVKPVEAPATATATNGYNPFEGATDARRIATELKKLESFKSDKSYEEGGEPLTVAHQKLLAEALATGDRASFDTVVETISKDKRYREGVRNEGDKVWQDASKANSNRLKTRLEYYWDKWQQQQQQKKGAATTGGEPAAPRRKVSVNTYGKDYQEFELDPRQSTLWDEVTGTRLAPEIEERAKKDAPGAKTFEQGRARAKGYSDAAIKRYIAGALTDKELKSNQVLVRFDNGKLGLTNAKNVRPEEILGPPDKVVGQQTTTTTALATPPVEEAPPPVIEPTRPAVAKETAPAPGANNYRRWYDDIYARSPNNVPSPMVLQNLAKKFSRADGGQRERYWNNFHDADEWTRRVTGNTFKIDPYTFHPIRRSDGLSLQELAGGKPPLAVEAPPPAKLPKELPDEPVDLLRTIWETYGQDAAKSFAQMDPAERDLFYSEISKAMKWPDPTNPRQVQERLDLERTEAELHFDALSTDMAERFARHTKDELVVHRANSAAELAYQRQAESLAKRQEYLANQILATRQALMTQAHQGAYRRVKDVYFDYTQKNVLDQALGSILPFNFWARQNFAYVARYFASHPYQFGVVLNLYQETEKQNQAQGIPGYARGNLFLWQNPDGSKVLWNISSFMPYNPFGDSEQLMTVMDAASASADGGPTTANSIPLGALLFGKDRLNNQGKVIGRDKGVVPTFLRPNPLLDLVTKTGQWNQALRSLGMASDGFGSPDPSDKRGERMTLGLAVGAPYWKEVAARTGLTGLLRHLGGPTTISDLDIEGPLNELLFGTNAGKPLTKVYDELAAMTKSGQISTRQGEEAIAALKEGNWNPVALAALDMVEGQNASRRLSSLLGFSSVVINSPREQLATEIYQGFGKAKASPNARSQTVIGPDGKKQFVEGDERKYFQQHPEASVLLSANDSPDAIRASMQKEEAFAAQGNLFALKKEGKLNSRDFNRQMEILAAKYPGVITRDDDDIKAARSFDLTEEYNNIGGERGKAIKSALDQYAGEKNWTAYYALKNAKANQDIEASKRQFQLDNPDWARDRKEYLDDKYGPRPPATGNNKNRNSNSSNNFSSYSPGVTSNPQPARRPIITPTPTRTRSYSQSAASRGGGRGAPAPARGGGYSSTYRPPAAYRSTRYYNNPAEEALSNARAYAAKVRTELDGLKKQQQNLSSRLPVASNGKVRYTNGKGGATQRITSYRELPSLPPLPIPEKYLKRK